MDVSPVVPFASYAAASILSIAALGLRKKARILALVVIWVLSLVSLCTAHALYWPTGANSTFASLIVLYLPYTTKLLALEEHAVNPELSSHDWSFVDYYRTWNNPRGLPLRLSVLDRTKAPSMRTRLGFSLRQAIKAAILVGFDTLVFQKILLWASGGVMLHDFSPEMEWQVLHWSRHQLRLRAMVSIQWIWSAYYFLDFSNCVLAIVAVTAGLDRPDEWPPLFGSLLDVTSVRSFWARFWHRLAIPTYSSYALLLSRGWLGQKPGSRAEKTLVPLFIFICSGLSHALVGWALGDAALSRDILFFLLNYLAIMVEVVLSKAEIARSRKRGTKASDTLWNIAGFAWVCVFFFCVSPLWLYPKIYHGILHA
ncbi:membrane bound O-acyl transferase family-domain-containing protein [Stachybotrys elegans]|uniref:Membrane bound O-acyl transferase family-domain-containing protein n=1 Tax=Stachybotrys elegans TaxID=80388 RepID=A0A8K0WUG0_9HYPO|nr:membrane bound O-acyl transferase family-domain-containing protein [Stachybotrys elegans]